MKKNHYKSLKFNTIYSFILAIIFLIIIITTPDILLGVTMVFLILYVAGNGLIHARHNKLDRDTLVEYIVISVIALFVLIDTIVQ